MQKIKITARSVELTEKEFQELNPGRELPMWAETIIGATTIIIDGVIAETIITISDDYGTFESLKTFKGELNLGEEVGEEVCLLSCVGELEPWEGGDRRVVFESGWVDISALL